MLMFVGHSRVENSEEELNTQKIARLNPELLRKLPDLPDVPAATPMLQFGNIWVIGTYGLEPPDRQLAGSRIILPTGYYTVYSDRRLKSNIAEITGALDIIKKLQPKVYDTLQDEKGKLLEVKPGKQYGLLAQELEEVLPELVVTTNIDLNEVRKLKDIPVTGAENATDEMELKSLNYTDLIPFLIKGMQEQQQMIEEQQKKIDKLMQDVEKLSAHPNLSVDPTKLNTSIFNRRDNQ